MDKVMTPAEEARWEDIRRRGLWRFALLYGLRWGLTLGFGSAVVMGLGNEQRPFWQASILNSAFLVTLWFLISASLGARHFARREMAYGERQRLLGTKRVEVQE